LGRHLAVGLLALGWLTLAASLLVEARRGGPELALRSHLADLEAQRLEAALGSLSPRAAERWHEFLEIQQLNSYQVVSVAVRSPSLLDSLLGREPWQPTQATLVANVTEPSGLQWQGSTIVPFEQIDGRWLLARPPFAPE
jgi:hypothetical protein